MSNLNGSWDITLHSPQGDVALALDLVTEEPPRGTMTSGEEVGDLLDFAVDGDSATWKANVTDPMPVTIDFSATAEGDSMTGTASVHSFIKMPFEGTRR